MSTVFCSNCGYVVARGNFDDPQQAIRDSGHSACPGCGSTSGVGFSFGELSDEEARAAVRSAGDPGVPIEQLLSTPGLHLRQRQAAGSWLAKIGLVMLVVGIASGGLFWYLWADWVRALLGGVVAAFTAAMIADRFIESPLD